MFKPHQATRVTINYICELVCRCLTCKVHPKTPIMSIATHRYSEKTSHHGLRTRYLVFCSEPKFLNSPTGIILAAAPHWWKRGRTEDTVAKIGFQHSAVSGEALDTGFKVVWHKKERMYSNTWFPHAEASDTCALQWMISPLFAVGGSKVEKLVLQHVTTNRERLLQKVFTTFFPSTENLTLHFHMQIRPLARLM